MKFVSVAVFLLLVEISAFSTGADDDGGNTTNSTAVFENSTSPEALIHEKESEHSEALNATELAALCANITVAESDVLQMLLSNYSIQARPRRNANDNVSVLVGLSLFGIRDFIERENLLLLDGYVSLFWMDEYFQWQDKFPFNCVQTLYFDAQLVWCPNLSFMSGLLDNDPSLYPAKGVKVSANSDGSMSLFPMGQMSVKCELDLQMFPFDMQICTVIMESWTYPNNMQSFRLYSPNDRAPFSRIDNIWVENEQWEIVENTSIIVHPVYYPNNTQIFDRCLFKMLLQRKSLFYRVHVILPGIIIAIVEVVTFVLPITEVVKLHISFTCLLAYSVFENMVMNDIPRSQTVPLLSIFINLQMGYIGLIAILGEGLVFMIIRQAQYKKTPPAWLFRIYKMVGLVVFHECDQLGKSNKITSVAPAPTINNALYSNSTRQDSADALMLQDAERNDDKNMMSLGLRNTTAMGGDGGGGERDENDEEETHFTDTLSVRGQWLYMAEVQERCNMWLYIMAVCVTPAVMFTLAPERKEFHADAQH